MKNTLGRSMLKNSFEIMKRISLLQFILLFPYLVTSTVIGQEQNNNVKQKHIAGVILSKTDNGPVVGAVVSEGENLTNATTTDLNGNFTLKVSEKSTLLIRCMGYLSKEIDITSANNYQVELEEDIKVLDEVVVVGYGTQKKTDLTGSVGIVNVDNMLKAPVESFEKALAGRIAGVQVSSADDQPGSGLNIVIRGGNSLTQDNSPLYVIDGFPIDGFNGSALNPRDIKSITILKDASSTAIYGSRGANGVVIIETLDGKVGKTIVTYDGTFGVQRVGKRMDLMNASQFVDYQYEINPVYATSQYLYDGKTLEDYQNVQAIDWQDMLFRDAINQSHNISLNGGNQSTRYSASLSYNKQDGVVINSGYNRYQGKIHLDHYLNKKVRVNLSTDYIRDNGFGEISSTSTNGTQTYASYLLYRTWGYRPLLGRDAVDITGTLLDPDANDTRVNPIIDVKNSKREKKGEYFRYNARIYYKITNNLELLIKGGIYNRTFRETGFYGAETSRGSSELSGNTKGINGYVNFRELQTWLNENTLTYRKKVGVHSFNALIGWTTQQTIDERWQLAGEQLPIEYTGLSGLDTGTPGAITAYQATNRMMSFLGRINYDLKNKYLFTVTFRADGSSKFHPRNQWGYFPSAAIAWRMSEEDFMKSLSYLHNAKFRLSYGQTGNDRIGDYSRFNQLSTDYTFHYPIGGSPAYGIKNKEMGNPGLKWETTEQYNAGLDFDIVKGRISTTIDWYFKKTRDLLLYAGVPYTTGYSRVYKNIGSTQNKGLELSLFTVNVQTNKFKWKSDFNISFNRNVILSLNEGQDRLLSTVSGLDAYSNSYLYLAKVGSSAAQFIGLIWDGIYDYNDFDGSEGAFVLKADLPSNGNPRSKIQPGDIKYKDIDGDGNITSKDNVVIGRTEPIHIGGFNNDFTYKNISLNVFFQWSYGNDILNANKIYLEGNQSNRSALNQFATYADRWRPDNTDTNLFRAGGQGPVGYFSSRLIEDGSYLRLKTVSLSYRLPSFIDRLIGSSGIDISLSAQNLYTWTKYSGMDPEVSVRNSALTPGFDYSAYPRSRSLVFGIKATF